MTQIEILSSNMQLMVTVLYSYRQIKVCENMTKRNCSAGM